MWYLKDFIDRLLLTFGGNALMKTNKLLSVLLVPLFLFASSLSAETITKTFSHRLLVGEQSKTWEHRIDLPDDAVMAQKRFITRELDLRMGKLVVESEVFTPMFYYVKVKLAKHVEMGAAGQITIKLNIGKKPIESDVSAPTNLKLSDVGATLKPIFTWKTEARYAAISLYDVDEQKTVWERVSTTTGFKAFDEPFYLKKHHYIWAVKVSDKSGRYSKPAQAAFKIITQDGVVIAVPE